MVVCQFQGSKFWWRILSNWWRSLFYTSKNSFRTTWRTMVFNPFHFYVHENLTDQLVWIKKNSFYLSFILFLKLSLDGPKVDTILIFKVNILYLGLLKHLKKQIRGRIFQMFIKGVIRRSDPLSTFLIKMSDAIFIFFCFNKIRYNFKSFYKIIFTIKMFGNLLLQNNIYMIFCLLKLKFFLNVFLENLLTRKMTEKILKVLLWKLKNFFFCQWTFRLLFFMYSSS